MKVLAENTAIKAIINRPISIGVLVLLGALGGSLFLFLPMLVGTYSEKFAMTETQMGLFASSDLVGFAISSLSAFFWIRTFNWRYAAIIGIVFIILGNVLTMNISSIEWLLATRIISGMGQGIVVSIFLAGANDTERTDRNIAIYLVLTTLFAALGYLFFPQLIKLFGTDVIFIFHSGLALVAFFFALFWLPIKGLNYDKIEERQKDALDQSASSSSLMPALLALSGLFLVAIGNSGIWAFTERIGAMSGLSNEFISQALSMCLIAMLVGSAIPVFLELKWGRVKPMALCITMLLVYIFLLFIGKGSEPIYMAAVIIYGIFNAMFIPYILGTISHFDTNGKLTVMASPVNSIGSAIGPTLMGLVIFNENYLPIGYISAVLFMMALIVVIWTLLTFKTKQIIEPAI